MFPNPVKKFFVIFFSFIVGLGCGHSHPSKKDTDTTGKTSNAPDTIGMNIDTSKINYNNLTDRDKHNYIIEVRVTGKKKDACWNPPKEFYSLTAILTNKSKDTLNYVDWTCSHAIWDTDNQSLMVDNQLNYSCAVCELNNLAVFTVLPKRSDTIDLRVEFKHGVRPGETIFRVGMIVQKVVKSKDFEFYQKWVESGHSISFQTQNLIWSNPTQIPN